jgi:toxin YhaV
LSAAIVEQLGKLQLATDRAKDRDPQGYTANANYKLFKALSALILETVPMDPGKDDFRQGNTMGPQWRHWRRAKIGQRFRLFFRYDSTTKIIVFAWVNDVQTLRAAGRWSAWGTCFAVTPKNCRSLDLEAVSTCPNCHIQLQPGTV